MGAKSDLQTAQPLTLKCGLTLPNRLVKTAMAEQPAGAKQLPDERMQAVYKHWSAGGWGLIITGNVHVDDAYLGMPSDPAMPPSLSLDSLVPPYSALARASQGGAAPPERRTPTIMVWGNDGPDAQEEESDRTKAREAFFLEFAKVIRKEFPGVPLMVTGGFSSRVGMEKAVAEGDCDLIGLARPAALNPSLPNNIVFNPEVNDQDATLYRKENKAPWLFNFIGMPAVGAAWTPNGIRRGFGSWQRHKKNIGYRMGFGKSLASVLDYNSI